MKLTVLLDLDNTLLINDVDQFLPAYFNLLSNQIPGVAPDKLIPELIKGSQAMVEKTSPVSTLEQVFDSHFYPGIGVTKEDSADYLENFYQSDYPSLKRLTKSQTGIKELVTHLFDSGHQVVIATNPLFPRTAILQRLNWAGLPPDEFPFDLITTFETLHYSKPNHAYYLEILGQLCWPKQPSVMIGDDWELDILPAAEIGMPTFWVTDEHKDLPSFFHPLSDQGPTRDILPWIISLEKSELEYSEYSTCAGIFGTLNSTPAAIETLINAVSHDVWEKCPQKNEWSITEIICHLRDVDLEINLPRLRMIQELENPFLESVDADQWVEERNYHQQDGPSALQMFIEARSKMLYLLKNFNEDEWNKTVRHSIFGPTSIRDLTNFVAIHDRSHIRQICDCIQRAARK